VSKTPSSSELRNTRLIEHTAKLYFEYKQLKREFSLEVFEKTLKDIREPLSDDVSRQIRKALLYMAIIETLRSAKTAKTEKLTYREYGVEYDNRVYGALLVPHTLVVKPMGLYAYITTKNTALHPSYRVLGALMWELYRLGSEYKEDGPFKLEERIKEKLKELEEYLYYFPPGEIREPQRHDPEWLQRALEAYYIYKTATFGYKKESSTTRYKIILPRLYEILTLSLLLKALSKIGYSYEFTEEGVVNVNDGTRSFEVLVNKPLKGNDIHKRVGTLNGELLESIKGKPDILMYTKWIKIAFECKYSEDLNYLTEGRFKVLAYIYEYCLTHGVLVSPGIASSQKDELEEKEIEDTSKLFDAAKDSDGILDIELRDGKTVFILVLDPLEELDKLEKRVQKLIKRLFTSP